MKQTILFLFEDQMIPDSFFHIKGYDHNHILVDERRILSKDSRITFTYNNIYLYRIQSDPRSPYICNVEINSQMNHTIPLQLCMKTLMILTNILQYIQKYFDIEADHIQYSIYDDTYKKCISNFQRLLGIFETAYFDDETLTLLYKMLHELKANEKGAYAPLDDR